MIGMMGFDFVVVGLGFSWGATTRVRPYGCGHPLRSLRSASPYASRRGRVYVACGLVAGFGGLVGRGRFETCPYRLGFRIIAAPVWVACDRLLVIS